MRRGCLSIVSVLVVAAVAAPAAADPVTIVKGPSSDRDAIVRAIEKVRAHMAVCWQRAAPATVRIALAIAPGGEVAQATAKTKGAAAQCAAGILAVSTLAPVAKPWKGEVDVATAAPGKAGDARAIHDALAAHGPTLFACQQDEPAFVGKVTLRVTVARDGTVTAAQGSVAEATAGAGTKVAACVAGAARGLALAAIQGDGVTYDLTLSYAGGAAKPGKGGGVPLAGQPALKGGLTADQVSGVIDSEQARVTACTKPKKPKKPAKQGQVTVRVEVAPDGKVASAKVKSSSVDDPAVEDCLVKAFRGMTFPGAPTKTVLVYPVLVGAK